MTKVREHEVCGRKFGSYGEAQRYGNDLLGMFRANKEVFRDDGVKHAYCMDRLAKERATKASASEKRKATLAKRKEVTEAFDAFMADRHQRAGEELFAYHMRVGMYLPPPGKEDMVTDTPMLYVKQFRADPLDGGALRICHTPHGVGGYGGETDYHYVLTPCGRVVKYRIQHPVNNQAYPDHRSPYSDGQQDDDAAWDAFEHRMNDHGPGLAFV